MTELSHHFFCSTPAAFSDRVFVIHDYSHYYCYYHKKMQPTGGGALGPGGYSFIIMVNWWFGAFSGLGPSRGTPKVTILSFSGIQSESKPPISHEIPPEEQIISTLRETDSLPLKIDGWKMTPPFYSFLFSWAKCYFQGGSWRVYIYHF